MIDEIGKDIFSIKKALKTKQVSCHEVIKSFLKICADKNETLNAFITIDKRALERADSIDRKIASGESLGPLAGVPFGIKDMLCTRGLETTAGSKMLKGFIPPYSATVIKKLEQSDAVIIGKCNQDEFAMGSSNENSYFGVCKNPWNKEYVPGGSSGGSAVSVAAGMAAASIGTDTGGSIRQPASFCGVVGVKPTYGRVSRYGIIAFASSLDQAGPITKTIKDAALVMETICGHDMLDSTSSSERVPQWSSELDEDLKGKKIGLVKEYFESLENRHVKLAIEKSIEALKDAGAEIIEVSLPKITLSVPTYYLIAASEASSNLSRYDGVRFGYRADFSVKGAKDLADFYARSRGEGFGSEVKRRIVLGTYALSSGYYEAYYKKACQVRRLILNDFIHVFNQCDALLAPVAPAPAFKIGESVGEPLTMYLNDVYTTATNLAGLPAASFPVLTTKENLPVGVQIISNQFDEQMMLNAALAIESRVNFKQLES